MNVWENQSNGLCPDDEDRWERIRTGRCPDGPKPMKQHAKELGMGLLSIAAVAVVIFWLWLFQNGPSLITDDGDQPRRDTSVEEEWDDPRRDTSREADWERQDSGCPHESAVAC